MIAISAIRKRAVLGVLFLSAAFCLLCPGLQAATGTEVETRNAARFVDNQDGTVLDRQTGLMWLKNGQSTLGAITWKEAGAFCDGLQYAGYSDWRLPTKKEWVTIVDVSNQSPALPLKSPFENVVTFLDYWTGNDHAYGPGYAWAVNLYYGKKKFLGKKKYAFAWPVRYTADAFNGNGKPLLEDGGRGPQWLNLKTKYTNIHYSEHTSLHALTRAFYPFASDPGPGPYDKRYAADLASAKLGRKVDALFREVQTLLDMRRAVRRVSITVYADKQQMETALQQTIGEGQQRRAWYNQKKNTISVCADQLSEDILAHEMALAIVYQYMKVPPPRTTVRILAGYVDSQRKSRRGKSGVPVMAKPGDSAPPAKVAP